MRFDRVALGRKARELGYVRDFFEKVCRLVDLLDTIQKDPLLSEKLVLKGGTALNLTIFNLPRLSVDIDMDFAENLLRDEMLVVRDQIRERISKYMAAAGYRLSPRSKRYHALDSFVYEYVNAGNVNDNIKIEINYMNRCHIMPLTYRQVKLPWLGEDISILCVDPIEICASKITALLNRAAARDLYDVYAIFQSGLFDDSQMPMLRKCTMFYTAIGSEKTPERFSFDRIVSVSQQSIKRDLVPVLRTGMWFDAKQAQDAVIERLKEVMDPSEKELSFWSEFRAMNYRPELLFDDEDIAERVKQHPMALWKCSDRKNDMGD